VSGLKAFGPKRMFEINLQTLNTNGLKKYFRKYNTKKRKMAKTRIKKLGQKRV